MAVKINLYICNFVVGISNNEIATNNSQLNTNKMKPVFPITVTSLNKTSIKLNAVFDTGSYYTIIRADKLPVDTAILKQELSFGTANKNARLSIIGKTFLVFQIGSKMIEAGVLVSPDLGSDILIGAQTMQSWDISIMNVKGKTKIRIAHDMRDPDINEVV